MYLRGIDVCSLRVEILIKVVSLVLLWLATVWHNFCWLCRKRLIIVKGLNGISDEQSGCVV